MAALAGLGCGESLGTVPLQPDQEDLLPNGAPFTPSTQSFNRGHHVLDDVAEAELQLTGTDALHVTLRAGDEEVLRLEDVPLAQLVPRLHYAPANPPDAFDALNLMLAEYSRNGLAMARGRSGEHRPRFISAFEEARPWTLSGDFEFVPSAQVLPLRVSVINNCLSPGLFELAASDRTGELYHSWFEFPADAYFATVAHVNGLDEAFVRAALEWRVERIPPALDRLRTPGESLGEVSVALQEDGPIGYSSQGSRQKVGSRFAAVDGREGLQAPHLRSELTRDAVHLVQFVPPGIYKLDDRRAFDVRFLAEPTAAAFRWVQPHTAYDMASLRAGVPAAGAGSQEFVELRLDLGDKHIVLGNLPLALLVPQEDFELPGFGVGVLQAGELVERRALRISSAPQPSFAYLLEGTEDGDGEEVVLNSHEYGIEQVFLRAWPDAPTPWLEVTISSYERIIDLVKYRVVLPDELVAPLQQMASTYTSPSYLVYTDDNVR